MSHQPRQQLQVAEGGDHHDAVMDLHRISLSVVRERSTIFLTHSRLIEWHKNPQPRDLRYPLSVSAYACSEKCAERFHL